MRTDYTGSAGNGPEGPDRPIWEARDTAEFSAVSTAQHGHRADPSSEVHDRGGDDEVQPYTMPPPPPPQSSGRHKAAHKAPRRRDVARAAQAAQQPHDLAADEHSTEVLELPATKRPRTRGELVRTGIRGAGQTLITLGAVVLLFVVYELFITDLLNEQTQENLTQELEQDWADDPAVGPDLPNGGLSDIPLGDGFALIRIPAFGTDYVRVIVEGTNAEELSEGPGHYVQSAMPGEVGNFALAGHRVSQGSPFLDLDKLLPGDAIVIETVDMYFTYRVLGDPATGSFGGDPSGISGQEIVSPNETGVVNPIPGVEDSSVAPTTAYLTLTTCHPKFSAAQRLIIHAVLEGPGLAKADYPDGPPAMSEG